MQMLCKWLPHYILLGMTGKGLHHLYTQEFPHIFKLLLVEFTNREGCFQV